MPVLLLSRVDKETTNICQLRPGEHVIGRGVLLEVFIYAKIIIQVNCNVLFQCNSKKVSRNHGLIRVTETGASLTSVSNMYFFYLQNYHVVFYRHILTHVFICQNVHNI